MPPFEFIHNYYQHPLYIQAVANSIQLAPDEFLLFSFHGIPQRYVTEGDFYPEHCQQTVALIAQQLGLSPEQWQLSYQSRFGKEEWLKPYTDVTLKQLAQHNIKKVAVVCPGFATDCLETLEEIAQENRHYFEQSGGESYRYIPALNASTAHIELLARLIETRIG